MNTRVDKEKLPVIRDILDIDDSTSVKTKKSIDYIKDYLEPGYHDVLASKKLRSILYTYFEVNKASDLSPYRLLKLFDIDSPESGNYYINNPSYKKSNILKTYEDEVEKTLFLFLYPNYTISQWEKLRASLDHYYYLFGVGPGAMLEGFSEEVFIPIKEELDECYELTCPTEYDEILLSMATCLFPMSDTKELELLVTRHCSTTYWLETQQAIL